MSENNIKNNTQSFPLNGNGNFALFQHPKHPQYPQSFVHHSKLKKNLNWNQYPSTNTTKEQHQQHQPHRRRSSPSSTSSNNSNGSNGSNLSSNSYNSQSSHSKSTHSFTTSHSYTSNSRVSRKRSLNDALDTDRIHYSSNKSTKFRENTTPNSIKYGHNNGVGTELVHPHHQRPHKPLIGLEAYEKLGKLGEGTYGIVHKAKDRRTGEYVALKRVKTGLSKNEKKTGFPITSIREIKILQNLDHPNIVRLREVVKSNNRGWVFLVFEYFEHDLASLLDKQMKRDNHRLFELSEIKCIIKQILSAIEYAHKHFVIHRDIKLSNILFSNNGQIVLCDWGLARLFSNPLKKHTAKVVTLWYRAPELLFGSNKYHTAIDMWAIGCIIGELLNGKPLMMGHNELEQIELIYKLLGAPNHHIWPNYNQLTNIINGTFKYIESDNIRNKYKYNQIDNIFNKYGLNCLDLIKQLLAYDPSKRITAKYALKHPFFDEHPKPCAKDMMPTFPVNH